MKQIIHLNKEDVDDAIEAYLIAKGFSPLSVDLRITPPYSSSDPREQSTSGTIKYECEVENNGK